MIFNCPLHETEPDSARKKVSLNLHAKCIAFNNIFNVYVDIFVFDVSQYKNGMKEDAWLLLNYFEVTTFDAKCDFLWGETIDDELSSDETSIINDYNDIFKIIENKPSMLKRKLEQKLKEKEIKNTVKI